MTMLDFDESLTLLAQRYGFLKKKELAEKAIAGDGHKTLESFLDDQKFWEDLGIEVQKTMVPVFQKLLEAGYEVAEEHLIVSGFKQLALPAEAIDRLLEAESRAFATNWWNGLDQVTRERLRGAIRDNVQQGLSFTQLTKDIEPLFGETRALRIASTETTRLFAKGAMLSYQQAGVKMVQWRSANDPWCCNLCKTLEGQSWPIGQNEEPPRHVSCRCHIFPQLEKQIIQIGEELPSAEDILADEEKWILLSDRWSTQSFPMNEALLGKDIIGTTGYQGERISAAKAAEMQLQVRKLQQVAEGTRSKQKVLFRGESYVADLNDQVIEKYAPGKIIKLDNLTASAVQEADASVYMLGGGDEWLDKEYPVKVFIRFLDSKGVKGAPMDPMGFGIADAGEIVLPRGASYQVESFINKVSKGEFDIPKGRQYSVARLVAATI